MQPTRQSTRDTPQARDHRQVIAEPRARQILVPRLRAALEEGPRRSVVGEHEGSVASITGAPTCRLAAEAAMPMNAVASCCYMAMVTNPVSIARYLAQLGELADVPPRAPSRGPPYWKSTVLRRKALGDVGARRRVGSHRARRNERTLERDTLHF